MWSTTNDLIDWPRANKQVVAKGRFRQLLTDFKVTELIREPFTDTGEHLYLEVEKRDLNTYVVQDILASHYRVPKIDVSFAGLKDKRAIATQWFSVRLPKISTPPAHPRISVLQERQHATKLRRGDHSGNRFEIVIRDVERSSELNFDSVLHDPFPNYFGPQRFGIDFNNLHRAQQWVANGRPRTSRFARSLYLSTLRSFVFNSVLAERIKMESWLHPLPGECEEAESVPTGPLWGRGRLPTKGAARDIEERIRQRYDNVCNALEWVGLKQERRRLHVQAENVACSIENSTVSISFALPPGTYATVALNEYFDLESAQS